MKTDTVTINTTHNGYVVGTQRSGGYAHTSESWSFESLSELQRRLPEILSTPFGQRTKECECKKND